MRVRRHMAEPNTQLMVISEFVPGGPFGGKQNPVQAAGVISWWFQAGCF